MHSVKGMTCLNFRYHQLVNFSQKALDSGQWKSKWIIVCFSELQKVHAALSVIPARKRLDLVGKIWWIILY